MTVTSISLYSAESITRKAHTLFCSTPCYPTDNIYRRLETFFLDICTVNWTAILTESTPGNGYDIFTSTFNGMFKSNFSCKKTEKGKMILKLCVTSHSLQIFIFWHIFPLIKNISLDYLYSK